MPKPANTHGSTVGAYETGHPSRDAHAEHAWSRLWDRLNRDVTLPQLLVIAGFAAVAGIVLLSAPPGASPGGRPAAASLSGSTPPTAAVGKSFAEEIAGLHAPLPSFALDESPISGGFGGGRFGGRGGGGEVSQSAATDAARTPAPAARQVARKATIELLTSDVRTAFLKATYLVQEAGGEYAEDSSLTGSGREMQANVTLRVAAGRLSEVLVELRQLGEVRSERIEGQDVTAQAVDLDARLHNERRVETELLELLSARKDAPLAEILSLRETLARVRASIEQLAAARERLARLVNLATVLVILRAPDAPPPAPSDRGLLAYGAETLYTAWVTGARFLVQSIGLFVSALVGGLPLWILLGVVYAIHTRHSRRTARP